MAIPSGSIINWGVLDLALTGYVHGGPSYGMAGVPLGPIFFGFFFSLSLLSRPKWPVLYHMIWTLTMQYGHTQQTSYQMGCSGPLGNRKCPLGTEVWHQGPCRAAHMGPIFLTKNRGKNGDFGGFVGVVLGGYNQPEGQIKSDTDSMGYIDPHDNRVCPTGS